MKRFILMYLFLSLTVLGCSNTTGMSEQTKKDDMARALISYLRMGYAVFQTPNYQGNLRTDCLYSLDNMEVGDLQKDGVIICVTGMDKMSTPIAFLYTSKEFDRGVRLHGWAYFIGVKQFRSTGTGDEKDIPTFMMNTEK